MTEMSPAEAVFFAAAALPPADRAAYLASACEGRDDLRRQVERMLAARAEIGRFLEPDRVGAPDDPTHLSPDATRALDPQPLQLLGSCAPVSSSGGGMAILGGGSPSSAVAGLGAGAVIAGPAIIREAL